MKLARLFAFTVLLATAARLSATVIVINFSASLPTIIGIPELTSFENTTISGSFTYDSTNEILQGQWDPNVTGVDNVAGTVQFSNGYHAEFTSSLRDYSPWGNSGYDLLVNDGPMMVVGGTYIGHFPFPVVNLLDANNNVTGIAFYSIAMLMPISSENLATGYSTRPFFGSVELTSETLGRVGVTLYNGNVAPAPDAAGTFGLLSLAMIGLVAMRRRLVARQV